MASKYPEIKKYLVSKIESGSFQEGQSLPTEKVLTQQFGVSRMTVRRAYDELIQEGYAHRKRGSSVVVSRHKNEISVNKVIVKDNDAVTKKYGKIHYEVISFEKIKASHICEQYLHMEGDEDVYRLRRITRGGTSTLSLQDLYFPKKYFPGMKAKDTKLFVEELFAKYLIEKGPNHRLEIIEAKNASKFESRILHIPAGAVTLHVTHVEHVNDYPFFLAIDTLDGNMFKYTSDVQLGEV